MEDIVKKISDHFKSIETDEKQVEKVSCYMNEEDFKKKDYDKGFMSITANDVGIYISHGTLYKVEFINKFEMGKMFDMNSFLDNAITEFNTGEDTIGDMADYWYGSSEIKTVINEVEIIKEVISPINEYNRAKSEILDDLLSRKNIKLKK